jgi:copper ion binding protein
LEVIMKTFLTIEGMSCDHCVRHVKEALEGIQGVKAAAVNLKKKTAQVDHGEGVTRELMKAAVEEAGYEVV